MSDEATLALTDTILKTVLWFLYANPSSSNAFQEEILDETDEYVNIHNK